MSFQDWYNPNRKSANAPNSINAGAQTGAQIGSLFGPVGAVVGTFVGGFVGGIQGNSGRKRARRKATQDSYGFAREVFSYGRESRENISNQYEQDLSLLTARGAASGGSSDDAFRLQKGKLIQTRDAALANLETEIEGFRQGPNYEWLRKNFDVVVGFSDTRHGSAKGDGEYHVFSVGKEGRLSNIPAPFTDKQRSMLQSYTTSKGGTVLSPGDRQQRDLMKEYAERVSPAMEWYERRLFGDESDVKAYNEYMDERIKSANKWYAAKQSILRLEERSKK